MKLVVSQTTIDDAHENMTAIALSICQKYWNKYMTECTMGQKREIPSKMQNPSQFCLDTLTRSNHLLLL